MISFITRCRLRRRDWFMGLPPAPNDTRWWTAGDVEQGRSDSGNTPELSKSLFTHNIKAVAVPRQNNCVPSPTRTRERVHIKFTHWYFEPLMEHGSSTSRTRLWYVWIDLNNYNTVSGVKNYKYLMLIYVWIYTSYNDNTYITLARTHHHEYQKLLVPWYYNSKSATWFTTCWKCMVLFHRIHRNVSCKNR